jgi:hypothetical protein
VRHRPAYLGRNTGHVVAASHLRPGVSLVTTRICHSVLGLTEFARESPDVSPYGSSYRGHVSDLAQECAGRHRGRIGSARALYCVPVTGLGFAAPGRNLPTMHGQRGLRLRQRSSRTDVARRRASPRHRTRGTNIPVRLHRGPSWASAVIAGPPGPASDSAPERTCDQRGSRAPQHDSAS